jgi:hypothetical protein
MDVTIRYALRQIGNINPKHRKFRYWKHLIEKEISDYRFTAYKNLGTGVARICNQKANWIEKQLKMALGE